jgi:predicted dehydrogenase
MSQLKVGVIGVGGIAKTHMPGWEASPHTEVIAGTDVIEAAAKQWGETWKVKNVSMNNMDIINNPDVDIIDICTPTGYHTNLVVAALEAGKHVICEKPLAATPAEIQQMIDARDASGKLLMTAQHFRFSGKSKAMKAELNTGVLGDVYHARSWMLRRAAIPTWGNFLRKEHSSGGACIDIGVHILDLTLWFMGNPQPISVTGVARTELAKKPGAFGVWANRAQVPPGMDVEEFASAFVRFDNGATLILEVSWMLHHDTAGEDMQMWLYGTDGGSHWPQCHIYQTNNETRQLSNRTLQLISDTMEPHALECVEFAQAIVDGAPSPVPAEQSMQVMKILDAVYQSQNTGCEVRLD